MPDHSSAQFDVFSTDLHLRRLDTVQNMRRFYKMTVKPDLFGIVSLIRVWDRIGTGSRQMIDTYPDEGVAMNAPMALAAEKRRRGYSL